MCRPVRFFGDSRISYVCYSTGGHNVMFRNILLKLWDPLSEELAMSVIREHLFCCYVYIIRAVIAMEK
jgi:hypothetical protein